MTGQTYHVLAIEDSKHEVSLLNAFLENATKSKYRLSSAGTVAEGLRQVREQKIDIIILDLNLPDSKGVDTLRTIHENVKAIPVVVLTGIDDESLAIEAVRKGFQDYIPKAMLNGKMLLRVLRHAIERQQIEESLKAANEKLAAEEDNLRNMLISIKKSNRELKSARLQLIQAAKMEVIGRLAAGVAHEVKNPLSMIRMGIDFLSKEVDQNDETAQFMLNSMSEAVGRSDNVIREMLDYSSPNDLKIAPTQLSGVIDRALFIVKHELDRNQITVNHKIPKSISNVLIDRKQIEHALVNLLTNSIQAIKGGGQISIEVSEEILKNVHEGVGYRKNDILLPGDKVVVLDIMDTGSGIPEKIMDKIYDPFLTTHRSEGGAGLGLSVVKTMVEMHQGLIKVQNRKEGGAHVRIILRTKPS